MHKGHILWKSSRIPIRRGPQGLFLRTFITSLEPVFVKNKTYFGCFGQH